MKNKKRLANIKCMMSMILAMALTIVSFPVAAFENSKVEAAEIKLSNPRIVKDDSMTAGQKVTWDCVWFGSYPQTEIISTDLSRIYTDWYLESGSVIISDSIYNTLQNASGWDENEIVIGNEKYKRMKKEDATNAVDYGAMNYIWEGTAEYHYFRYEPIKWLVLDTDGKQALLLADAVLDNQSYHSDQKSVVWEKSGMRSWLNGYDAGVNDESIDYGQNNFIDKAFSGDEQQAIIDTMVRNENNGKYGTNGGNDTVDKIFFLSESEVCKTDKAVSYGFGSIVEGRTEAYKCRMSTYAYAMGVWYIPGTPGVWWLRTPGATEDKVTTVQLWGSTSGWLDYDTHVDNNNTGVRPALRLDLTSPDFYDYAGTVCSDGTYTEAGADLPTDPGLPVFNASIYHANVVLNSLSNLSFIYPDTPCEKLSRQAEYTGLSSSAQAWKGMKDVTDAIDDPTNIMDKGLSEKDFYEGIIFSIFEETTSFHNDKLAAVEDAIRSMDDFMSYITTNMKAVYDIELYEDNQVSTLTDKQVEKLQEISEAYFDSNGIVKTANVMSKLVEVIKYVKDIGEYCEYVCNSAKLLHMNESYKAVLQDMYEVCPSENVNLRLALKECISIMEASEEEFAMKMGTYGVAIAGKNIIKTGLSKMWKTALNKVRLQNPCAASIWAGYKSGIYISDTLLNTSNIAEKTLQMHMMYDVKKILTEVYGKGVGEFDHERSEALAEKFLAVVDVCFKYKDADCDCAYGFVETVDNAIASKIREIFGSDSNDTLKKQIKSIQKDSLVVYNSLCTDWIRNLEHDYPEEYEKYKDLLGNDNTVRICKSYEIACPVDVYVYDENNKLVASVIGNKVYCGDDSEMTVMCVDTHKTIYFYDSAKKYSIRYVGTDTGKMDITVNEYGTEGEKLRTVKHIDVPLTKGKTYSSEENVEATDELSYQLVEDGNENVLEPTADTANTNLKKYTLSVTGGYLCNEDGNMSFSGEYYAGEKVTVCANVPENYIWQGWTTSNPQNVISNPSERNITIIMPANSLELVGNSKKKSEQQVIIPSTPDKNVTDVPGSTSNKSLPKVGTRFAVHDDIDDGIYMVTKEGATLAFVGPVKKSVFVRIASRLMINGVSYRVESIGKNAFKGNKKIRAITIPKTVRTIGKGAFYKCKNLSKVIIEGNALSTVKARAFKGTSKKMKVIFKSSKVTPKKRLTLFKKMKKSGMSKSAKLVKYGR